MVISTCKCMSASLYISRLFMCVCIYIYIYIRCRKHWPALRAANVSEQTHIIDFSLICVFVHV